MGICHEGRIHFTVNVREEGVRASSRSSTAVMALVPAFNPSRRRSCTTLMTAVSDDSKVKLKYSSWVSRPVAEAEAESFGFLARQVNELRASNPYLAFLDHKSETTRARADAWWRGWDRADHVLETR